MAYGEILRGITLLTDYRFRRYWELKFPIGHDPI